MVMALDGSANLPNFILNLEINAPIDIFLEKINGEKELKSLIEVN